VESAGRDQQRYLTSGAKTDVSELRICAKAVVPVSLWRAPNGRLGPISHPSFSSRLCRREKKATAFDASADLLLVDSNPLEDINLVANPSKNFVVIMKDGKIYKNTLSK
jgi:hypothetical protein